MNIRRTSCRRSYGGLNNSCRLRWSERYFLWAPVLLIQIQEKHENISFARRCCYLVAGERITQKFHFPRGAGLWCRERELLQNIISRELLASGVGRENYYKISFLESCWPLVSGDRANQNFDFLRGAGLWCRERELVSPEVVSTLTDVFFEI